MLMQLQAATSFKCVSLMKICSLTDEVEMFPSSSPNRPYKFCHVPSIVPAMLNPLASETDVSPF